MTAQRPDYEGSTYHKRYPSPWGPPAALSDKTECPSSVHVDEVLRVLPDAIAAGIAGNRCSRQMVNGWPKHVWGASTFRTTDLTDLNVTWEAQLSNPERGVYHAYPVTRARHAKDMSPEVEEVLWP